MKVITNTGEYATVTKVMANHFEIRYDNRKIGIIQRSRCEELVPIHMLKACQEELEMTRNALHKSHEKHLKVATKIHKLHFELGEQINHYNSQEDLNMKQLTDRYRCRSVWNKLEEILAI